MTERFLDLLVPVLSACENAVSEGVARGGALLGAGVARLVGGVGLLRSASSQEQRDAAIFVGGAGVLHLESTAVARRAQGQGARLLVSR